MWFDRDMNSEYGKYALSYTPPTDYSGDIPRAGVTESKLGGAPYQPSGWQWPQGMMFLAQLRLDELAAHPQLLDGHLPQTGMLQFFLPAAPDYGQFTSAVRCHVRWLEMADEPSQSATWWDGTALQEETTNPARYSLDTPGAGTLQPSSQVSPLSTPGFPLPLSVEDAIPNQLPMGLEDGETIDPDVPDAPEELCATGGIQVGGYAYFAQADPREASSSEILLFQLDGDYPGINLGDSGTMQFFITPDDLRERNFENVTMDWACY